MWTEADYSPIIAGSGARKLATSAVAPLVAAGRGMLDITPANLRQMQSFLGCGTANTKPARCVANAVGQTDALYMPWYDPQTVTEMRRDGSLRPSLSPQFRPNPQNVILDENQKGAKYVNLAGRLPIIGLHPATPTSWQLKRGLRAMFTEGMIKADSALTALLLDAGIGADDLRLTETETTIEGHIERANACRDRLTQLMERVPEADQIMIYGFLSVTTFSRNPEWRAVDVRDQDVYVAFDGDTATNPNVWRSGKQLFEFVKDVLHATPKLIDLSKHSLPDNPAAKCGMDDYLALLGDWQDLINLAVDELPPRPVDEQASPGEWRMNPKTLTTEEFIAGSTSDEPGSWREKYPFVARVRAVEDRRQVLPDEAETGVYIERTDARDMDSRVEIEVAWRSAGDDHTHIGIITGSHELLMAPVSEWRRINPKPAIPSTVALLPAWPPREPEFLNAMKRYRVEDRIARPLWNHMGWVPTKDDVPVFLIGDQVVGADGFMPAAAASAVTGAEMKVASKYGVQLPDNDQEVRDAFLEVMDTYRPKDHSKAPFRNYRHASIILAAGMRPCAPRACRAPILLSGSSGGGKSWASAAAMMFWQKTPGSWTDQSLPGSASDTYADIEVSISKTPIWVVDDLAPSEDDPTGTGKKASAVFTLMRHAHNGTSRGRRQSDMRAMDSNPPRALMFVSAEQTPEHQQSIMNRVIHIKVRSKQFLSESHEPTNRVEELGATTSSQSLLTGYCLTMLARRARNNGGWARLLEDLNDEYRFHEEQAYKIIGSGGEANRQSRAIADLALGLTMLDWMMTELGMERQLADRLASMRNDLYQAAKEGYQSSRETVLGSQFLSALRSTLRSRNAHVGAFGNAGVPMTAGEHGSWKGGDADFVNDALGWMPGDDGQPARPGGSRIGDLVFDKGGNPCIVFDPKAAFGAVRRVHDGFRTHTWSEVWDSVVTQGFRHDKKTAGENGWSVKMSGGGANRNQRVTKDGRTVEGVVISLAKLLDAELAEDDLDNDQAA